MEVIIIKKIDFDNLFQQTLDKLKLENLDNREINDYNQMHRKFHYEVCVLKDRLEKR